MINCLVNCAESFQGYSATNVELLRYMYVEVVDVLGLNRTLSARTASFTERARDQEYCELACPCYERFAQKARQIHRPNSVQRNSTHFEYNFSIFPKVAQA